MKIESATPAQREAITTDHKRVLVLAGPGSGKTATTVARIKRLIDDGVPASEIVALTFTNAAARELEARLTPKPMGEMSKDIAGILVGAEGVARMEAGPYSRLGYCGTLHGFCLRLLKENGGFMGYGARLSIVSPESVSDLLASKAQTLGCKYPLKDLLALKAKGRPARGARLDLAQTVVASYFDDLKDAGIVDFDVLLTDALELIRNATAIVNVFSFLFVDEVQDSSDIDWAIYEALPIRNKFFVGDPDQAIYSFRGGNVRASLATATQSATHVIKLEENFRSHAEICEAANNLIARNVGRIDKKTISANGPGGRVVVLDAAMTEGEEIGIVARDISDLAESDNDPENHECFDPKDIAILARTNAIATNFRKTLAACGIPVIEREQSALPMDWPLARAFVEFLANPDNDTLAFFLLVTLYQKKGANPKDARDAAHAAKRSAASVGKSLNRASIGLDRRDDLRDLPQILQKEGISLESRALVAEKIKEVGPNATPLELALAMAGTKELVKEGTGEGVSVLTIHASKGREFDVVYLVGFEDEIIPGRRSSVDVEEERRLAYVAVTRARKVLVFSGAQSRVTPWGAINQHSPSRFVLEAVKGAAP